MSIFKRTIARTQTRSIREISATEAQLVSGGSNNPPGCGTRPFTPLPIRKQQ